MKLALSPHGRIIILEDQADTQPRSSWENKVKNAFSKSQAAGLFTLDAIKSDAPVSPSLAYWRTLSTRYLTELCRIPDSEDGSLESIETPTEADLVTMVLRAPPMAGAEYLSVDIIQALWTDLDSWVRKNIKDAGLSLSNWIKKHAPRWHQVGRVCFHLAENKANPQLPFAFLATYAPKLSNAGRIQYQPLNKALQQYAGERNKGALVKLLSPVYQASENSEFINELVESGDIFHPLAWTPDEAHRFLKDIPLMEESGLLVRMPDWWRKRPRPRVSVTIGEKKKSNLGVDSMLEFNVDLALGDKNLTKKEQRQLMEADDGLLYLKGQWVEVDRKKLTEALEHWQEVEKEAHDDGLSFIEGMRLLAGAPPDLAADEASSDEEQQWAFVNPGKWLSSILSNLRDPTQLAAAADNKEFKGTLRHYQKDGHNWLRFLTSMGLGACLADDMGLGKTVQIISLLLTVKKTKKAPFKPSLLVLPASLLSNWKAELERFAPTLKTRFVHLSEASKDELAALENDPEKLLSKTDVVLTTYGMLLRQKWLLSQNWRLAILDEAQAIKNPSARQTKAVKNIKAESRIALTGTPVENRLSDLWSLFDFICPGLLGSTSKFKAFMKGNEGRTEDRYLPLRNLVSPYILRRLKTDKSIISDLPDKTEMQAFCGLEKKQAALYTKSVDELERALKELEGIKRRGIVLSYLLRFKQICNHPSQFLGDGVYERNESGKFERLRSICEVIASRQEKVLVFTQFREMTAPLVAFLTEIFGREGQVLHGGTPVKKRRTLVENFQREDGPPFFVLSLKAGGTGLNLTAASHVIHFDRWWNPAVENQATDRAFRIGQHRNVVVHKFICRGTIEEKIDALISEKTALADDLLKGGAEKSLTEMSDNELLNIVALDVNRARL